MSNHKRSKSMTDEADSIPESDQSYDLVTVLMPAFNHEAFVTEAIQSVWSQSYPNVELIVVDDCSTDQTPAVISELVANAPRPTYYFRNESNQGISKSLNKALSIAKGKWIGLLASDDYYSVHFLAEMMAAAKYSEDVERVMHSDAFLVHETGRVGPRIFDLAMIPPASGMAFWDLAEGKCKIIPSTLFAPRSVYELVGGFDEKLTAEDFDLHLRIARVAQYVFVNKPIFFVRKVRGSLGSKTAKWAGDVFVALEKHRKLDPERIQEISRDREIDIMKKLFLECDIKNGFAYWRKITLQTHEPGRPSILRLSSESLFNLILGYAIRLAGHGNIRRGLSSVGLYELASKIARRFG